ncbi:4-coumarate-CoA ligase-like protein [Lineolata rhizophorae]|uniref:4-coumarate-CoA ligase-like protein n=1 Tax=Lineolata rhizophorae TaxID=578093 RepID=A0A6A6NYI4_9PEZI|nr:4-coumarate-CoA ligase-like protein [Lineolata rhizophorae]
MPIASSFPPIEIPGADIWSFLFEPLLEYPESKAIFVDPYASRSYTRAQVKAAAADFGRGLKAIYGWRKGDVLALFTPNCIDTPVVTWGCHWAGGVVSPANPTYTAEELAFQLKDCGAKALVTQWPVSKAARQAAQQAGIDDDRIILIGDGRDPDGRFKHFTSIRNTSGAVRYRRTKLDAAKDLAFLVYSSGTTGLPKGVMLTHRNLVANLCQLRVAEVGDKLSWKGGLGGDGDKILGFLPFFHIYGLNVLIHLPLLVGLTVVVMPKFDIEGFCELVQRYKITYTYVAPPVVLLLSKHPAVEKYDLSSLRMLNSGAAPLTRELTFAAYDRTKVPIKQAYGLSETSPSTHVQPWDDWDKTTGCAGRLIPNETAKLMSTEEQEVASGEAGEIWIKGPNIFVGYWNNPEGTAAALTPDGYFKTGDIGYVDAEGNFYVTDRVKELIKYKGFQVAPAELEGLLVSHPNVADAAVVGVFSEDRATELPRAYVVPSPGGARDEGAARGLTDWLAARVADSKKLRGGLVFVDEIPKSASGKILRRVLRERARDESRTAGRARL